MKRITFLFILFLLTPNSYLLTPLPAQEPKTVKLILSPETTYLTEPQLPDGRIDYLAAINKQLAAQTTPENNLIVGVFSIIAGEKEVPFVRRQFQLDEKEKAVLEGEVSVYRNQFCKMLGLAAPPPLDLLVGTTPGFFHEPIKDYEKELLEFYSKEELAPMLAKMQDKEKDYAKSRLDKGEITQEEYETRIKEIEVDRWYYRNIVSDQWRETLQRPWTAEEFPYIAKWLASTDEWAPKLLDVAQKRTGYYHPLLTNDENSHLVYEALLPYAQSLREAARYFGCRGNFEFAQGHFDQAMENAFATVRIGRTTRSNPGTLVEDLIGIAMIGMGDHQLITYLAILPKEKDAAWILQKKKEYDAIEATMPSQRVPTWYLLERCGALSAIQAVAVESKMLYEFLKDCSEEELVAKYEKLFNGDTEYDWNEVLKQINLFYDDWEEMLLIPNRQRQLRAAARLEHRAAEYGKRNADSSDSPEQRATDFMLGTLSPAIEPVMLAIARSEWTNQVTSVAFSLAAYRADHDGESPDTLKQLVPKYLAEIPLSPYTDKPLRYIKRQHDVLIANDDEYQLDGSEGEVEKKIAETKPGGFAFPTHRHFVFVVVK